MYMRVYVRLIYFNESRER